MTENTAMPISIAFSSLYHDTHSVKSQPGFCAVGYGTATKDISCSRILKVTAAEFGKTPIDVDQLPYSIDWQRELIADESFYSNYVQQYVKKAGSENLNSWQILANRLKQS